MPNKIQIPTKTKNAVRCVRWAIAFLFLATVLAGISYFATLISEGGSCENHCGSMDNANFDTNCISLDCAYFIPLKLFNYFMGLSIIGLPVFVLAGITAKGKKWAWFILLIGLSLMAILLTSHIFSSFFDGVLISILTILLVDLLILTAATLLLLDRKNYFAAVDNAKNMVQ